MRRRQGSEYSNIEGVIQRKEVNSDFFDKIFIKEIIIQKASIYSYDYEQTCKEFTFLIKDNLIKIYSAYKFDRKEPRICPICGDFDCTSIQQCWESIFDDAEIILIKNSKKIEMNNRLKNEIKKAIEVFI